MPNVQVSSLVVEHPLAPKLHAEDEEAEQLCQAAAKDIETEVYLKAVAQIGEGVFPECAVLVHVVDLAIELPHGGMVHRRTSQQTVQLHGLDGQQSDDAPDGLRRQIADGNEQQTIAGIEHQDVAVVERHIDDTEHEEQTHAPGEAPGEAFALLLLVVVHDKETQAEEHGEDAIHLAGQQPGEHVGYCLVAGQRMEDGLLREDVEVLNGVIQDDTCHCNASQGIGYVNACVG